MIEAMQRALDVSFLETVTVPIGGNTYSLTPQSAPQLERILNAIFTSTDADFVEETEAEKKLPWGTVLCKNHTRSVPIIAMMFGFDPKTPEGKECVADLHQYLPPRLTVKIYEEWRRINDIDDFLLRAGKPFLDPELMARLKKAKTEEVDAVISQGIQEIENLGVDTAAGSES
jgi:hypothetical protein